MRFASRLIPHAGGSARGYFLMALGVLALGLGGCEDKHIGRPCITNATDAGAGGGQVAIISSPNLQCPERICLQPAPEGLTGSAAASEGAMCTAGCSTDDDCSDADPATHCKSGFVCTWATTAGPFCCQKLCVCHDFVTVPSGGFPTPSTCLPSGSGGPNPPTCQNVQ